MQNTQNFTCDSRIGDLPLKHSDMGIYGPVLTGDKDGESLPSSIGDFSSCSSSSITIISTSELSPTGWIRTGIWERKKLHSDWHTRIKTI